MHEVFVTVFSLCS